MNENLPFIWRKYYRHDASPSEKVSLETAHEKASQYFSRAVTRSVATCIKEVAITPLAQNASARPEGEMVEVVLTASAPDIQPEPVQIRVPFTWKVAQSLGAQLNRASMAAEQQGWKLGHF